MSVRVMTWVWDNGPTDAVDKLVLLALADFANDEGKCWPSMATIAAKSNLTERGARNIVRRLEAGGWVQTERNAGRGNSNVYRVILSGGVTAPRVNWAQLRLAVLARDGERCAYCGTTQGPFDIDHVMPKAKGGTDDADNLVVACRDCNNSKADNLLSDWVKPERKTGKQYRNAEETRNATTVNPERDDTKPGTSVPPNHHRTIIEPSKSKSAPEKKARRTAIPETAVLSAKQIAIASEAGFTLEEAEAQFERFKGRAIAKGETYANWDHAWRNWFTSPYFKTITRNPHVSGLFKEPANGPAHRVDPALEQIARLAGLGQAPRNDCGGTGSHGEEVRPLRLGTRP